MSLIDDKILQEAINTFGIDNQIEMVKEESIELALSIQKLSRAGGDREKKFTDVIDELADMAIMLEQAKKIFNRDLINKRITFKMNRLEKRIKIEKDKLS